MAVSDTLESFETWLPMENFDNAECIHQQWVEMSLKQCTSDNQEARKKVRRGNKRQTTELPQQVGKKAPGDLPELPTTTLMVAIRPVPNVNNDQTSGNQLRASYSDVRHWEELIDFIERNCSPKEPYCLTAIYKCNLMQEELDKEYMGLYAPGQMMNDHLYGQISYNSSLSNAFKLKLGHNLKLLLVELKAATGKDIAEDVLRTAKVIPASLVPVRYPPLLISGLRLWRDLMKMEEWWMRRHV